ncbi:MAG: MerR family transcriptional regulator [Ilumatobacter sp.]|nr:MerR family transcriptional regulator [Ilumatobacter sp.]
MPDRIVRGSIASHLSIGEVLALLLEEFPDITISKIRFLESQGLIDPERTPSGYRKFYDADVELLRCILREQRENYLPLRVIKDRLDSGEIDPTNETPRPRGIRNLPDDDAPRAATDTRSRRADPPAGEATLFTDTSLTDEPLDDAPATLSETDPEPRPPAPSLLPGVVLSRAELCSMASLSDDELAGLESYGVLGPVAGSGGMYGEDELEIAATAQRFLQIGFDARHLRGWKVATDREAGLFEQMIQPLVRQRNPHAREQARAQLMEMEQLGGQLRNALMRATMRQYHRD